MNILLTSTAYPPSTGGAQLLHHQTALQLRERHCIEVVTQWDRNRTDWLLGTTLCGPSEPKDYLIENIRVHRLGVTLGEKLRMAMAVAAYYPAMSTAIPLIAKHLEKRMQPYASKADIVHNMRIGREPISFASFNLARKLNIPFVLTPVHHPRWTGWRYSEFISLYRKADAILALTESERRTLTGLGVPEERIHVIGMGPNLAAEADAERFRARYHIRDPFVLFVGQHYPYKGYRQLLQASNLVWKRIPEAKFVFIGPAVGDSERVFATFRDPRIHSLGHVTLQEKTDALAACAVLCVPSTQESFGGVYTEAWQFAKPVIGCRIPSVSEVISEGRDGLLVKQHADEIAEAICQLLLDEEKSQQMGHAGQEKVQQQYTWRRIGDRVEDAYRRALRGSDRDPYSKCKPETLITTLV